MNRYMSLLLPLDGSLEAAKGAGCALWLAETFGADLHVLHAATQSYPAHASLVNLHVPASLHAHVILHQITDSAATAVLDAITNLNIDLVIMSSHGESVSTGHDLPHYLGSTALAVLERTPVPVLLLPLHYRETLPWKSILVAASGEVAADQALETASHLAAILKVRVTVVHVEDGPVAETRPLGTYSDSTHYEYPYRMQEMVERGLATCTPSECGCVEGSVLRRGDPATVLLRELSERKSNVLALGWHGAFNTGHAAVLKHLLEQSECALLLLRTGECTKARLKVGREMDA
jgi:nucleotide-binding universal stress UspA family protein